MYGLGRLTSVLDAQKINVIKNIFFTKNVRFRVCDINSWYIAAGISAAAKNIS